MGLPWQTALGCVFLSGLAFLLLTVAGVRQLIISAVPRSLFAAVAGGIGLFIAFIGFADAGIVVAKSGTIVGLGNLTAPMPALALLGLVIIAVLQAMRIKAAMLLGILTTAVIAWVSGAAHFSAAGYNLGDVSAAAFKLDIRSALNLKGGVGLSLLEIVFVFLFVDLFDNVGTLVAVTKRAGLMAPDGSIPKINRILLADSISMLFGALVGTSPVTSYIESAAGVSVGGRTGLTSIVVGTLLFAPLVEAIPAAATAPALVLVGALMMGALAEVDWAEPAVAIPAFLTAIIIPLTYSIANGLAFGITSHALLKLLRGQARAADWLVYVLAALCVARFVYMGASG
jgi:AGZA family xanthine/uracil permease-like MFS transporter